jgi:8-oxo-dGTP pyrophosphatase MutT (NUDIX family)
MRTLKIFEYDQNLNIAGKIRHRKAARAIIFSDQKILMVYSTVNEDFKFPGGGVKTGESLTNALEREVLEETGMDNLLISNNFGKIIEYRKPYEKQYDVFQMNSYYYLCSIPLNAAQHATRLDDYEIDLGFTPKWVEIQEALLQNHVILQRNPDRIPRWTLRDTFVLELLQQITGNS